MTYSWNNTNSTSATSTPFTWSFPAIQSITVEMDATQKYQTIAKEFIERYTTSSSLSIAATDQYYNTDSLFTIHVHQNVNHHLYEMVGHTNFKNKMSEISITTMKYHGLTYTSQPVGKNGVLISMNGKAEINNTNYSILSTFMIKMSGTNGKIINQVLEIFI